MERLKDGPSHTTILSLEPLSLSLGQPTTDGSDSRAGGDSSGVDQQNQADRGGVRPI
jgi:hypothetical protein